MIGFNKIPDVSKNIKLNLLFQGLYYGKKSIY